MMNEYDRWEGRFAAPEYIFGTAPNVFLVAHRELLPKRGHALAIADGEGRNGVWLAEQGLDVFAFDFSPTAQSKPQALARARGVNITTALTDVAGYDWPADAFDVVIDIFTQFSDPAERAQKFAGIRRTLKPGGLLLLQGYRPEQIAYGTGGPKVAENMYTRALAGAIYVFDEAAGEFRLRATYGMDDALIAAITDRHMHIGETAIGRAAAQRTPIQIADAQADPASPVLDIIVRAGFRALLTVPLLAADRIVGALVIRRRQPGEFPRARSICCRPSPRSLCWRSTIPTCSRSWRTRVGSFSWRARTSRRSYRA
jgi:SAM-dependent methyltransferase